LARPDVVAIDEHLGFRHRRERDPATNRDELVIAPRRAGRAPSAEPPRSFAAGGREARARPVPVRSAWFRGALAGSHRLARRSPGPEGARGRADVPARPARGALAAYDRDPGGSQ
jgi:hypothetical protein